MVLAHVHAAGDVLKAGLIFIVRFQKGYGLFDDLVVSGCLVVVPHLRIHRHYLSFTFSLLVILKIDFDAYRIFCLL